MKKVFLSASLLLGCSAVALAQIPATMTTETQLPLTVGAVSQPMTANSTTLQQIPVYGGVPQNFYMHSWDVSGSGAVRGIAWRRTNSAGGLIHQGHLIINGAFGIDVALFSRADTMYALASFYFLGGSSTGGYYYNLYRFTPTGGLAAVSTMNLLMLDPSAGRTNVDVNGENMNLAITWAKTGGGLYLKAFETVSGTVTSNIIVPGVMGTRPDICISREPTDNWMHLSYTSMAGNQCFVQRLKFSEAIGTGAVTPSLDFSSPVMPSDIGNPRIDAPDRTERPRWALVYEARSTGFQRIYAAVKNEFWSTVPAILVVQNNTAAKPLIRPVVTYNAAANQEMVGWISTMSDTIYHARLITDPTTGVPPSVMGGAYMHISNFGGIATPVLAFSGQNTRSNFNGLHAAYSQFDTYFPLNYSMVYRNKPWGFPTFRMDEGVVSAAAGPVSVYPNPFTERLSFSVPLKGHYLVRLCGIDGKVAYSAEADYEAMQQQEINTVHLTPGIYFLTLEAPELGLHETRKLLK